MTFAELEAAHKKSPDSVDIAARLAAEYARRGKPADARKLADAVLAKEQGHPGASLVKARLLQRDKDTVGATAVLEEAAKANPDDVRVLAALGRLQVESKEFDRAAVTLETIRARGGVALDLLETLAKLHDAAKQPDKLAPVLEEIAARAPDNLAVRLRLAKLHSANGGRPDKAEYWAREALFVEVMNEDARGLLLAALRNQKNHAEVEKLEARYR
jgi:Tfp pilus assembly protein PilF